MTDIKKVTEGMPLEWLLAKDGPITQDELNATAKTVNYNNRDLMPEPYLHFSDLYHEMTGQELTKRVLQDWMMTFEYWKQDGLTAEDIRAAFAKSNDINGGFPVGRPGALTTTANAMKTKKTASTILAVDQKAIEGTKVMMDNIVKDLVFVPRPANVAKPVFKTKEGRS